MKKNELWTIYVQKNPKFAASGSRITFTEVGVYQFFERTWDLAHSEGIKRGRELEGYNSKPAKEDPLFDSSSFNDIFGGIFGKRK